MIHQRKLHQELGQKSLTGLFSVFETLVTTVFLNSYINVIPEINAYKCADTYIYTYRCEKQIQH